MHTTPLDAFVERRLQYVKCICSLANALDLARTQSLDSELDPLFVRQRSGHFANVVLQVDASKVDVVGCRAAECLER